MNEYHIQTFSIVVGLTVNTGIALSARTFSTFMISAVIGSICVLLLWTRIMRSL